MEKFIFQAINRAPLWRQQGKQLFQPCLDIRAQMHPEHPAPAFGQHLEITPCLGRPDHPEAVVMPRHRQVDRVGTGNLQKDPVIGASLVGLPG